MNDKKKIGIGVFLAKHLSIELFPILSQPCFAFLFLLTQESVS